MARILSHPFRLAANGAAATVDQDSAECNAEQIAVLVLTRPGERPLAPGFGVADPTFSALSPTELAAGVAEYGPPVVLRDVEARPVDDHTLALTITFD